MGTYTVGPGKTYSTLVGALAAAASNDVFVVDAGVQFTTTSEFGHFPSVAHDVRVISSAIGFPFLPVDDEQIDPAIHAPYMFTIKCYGQFPGLTVGTHTTSGGAGAHDWTFEGMLVESVGGTTDTTVGGIYLGGSFFSTRAQGLLCYNFTFKQCGTIPAELDPDTLESPEATSLQSGMVTTIVGTTSHGCRWYGGTGHDQANGNGTMQSMGVLIAGGTFTDWNSRIQAWQNPFFCGGSGGAPNPDRNPTVTASAINLGLMTGTATLGSVVEAPVVGDYITFKVSATPVQNSTHRMGVVTSVSGSGSTRSLAYTLMDGNVSGGGAEWATPGVAPLTGELCAYRGDNVGLCTFHQTRIVGVPYELKDSVHSNKAWGEIKDGTCVFEGVVFEDWKGNTVACYPQNQVGDTPWVFTDVTFRDSVFWGSKGCVGINLGSSYHVAIPASHSSVTIDNCYNTVNSTGVSYAFFGLTGTGAQVSIDHFTSMSPKSVFLATGASPTISFTNSIVVHDAYGFNCDGAGTGGAACYGSGFSRVTLDRTVLVDTTGIGKPTISGFYNSYDQAYIAANVAAVGFVDADGGDYRLSVSSPYRLNGTDGEDVGFLYPRAYAAIHPDNWPFDAVPTDPEPGGPGAPYVLLYA